MLELIELNQQQLLPVAAQEQDCSSELEAGSSQKSFSLSESDERKFREAFAVLRVVHDLPAPVARGGR